MEKTIRWFCVGFLAGAVCWCLDSAPGLRNLDGGRDAVAQVDAGAGDCVPCFDSHSDTVDASPFEFQLPSYDAENPPAVEVYLRLPDTIGRLVWWPRRFAIVPVIGSPHAVVQVPVVSAEFGAPVRILVFR